MTRHRPSQYHYSFRLLLPFLRVLQGKPSVLSRDAELLLCGADPAPCVLNAQNIPSDSSFLVVFNHYDRPGLGAWWGIAPFVVAIASHRTREPRQVHVMLAREWYIPNGFDHQVKQPLTRWFFGKFAKTYDCIGLPPALDLPEFRGQGATAIRRALALTHANPPELLAVSPEGNTGNDLGLCHPPHGAGLMLLLLAYETIPFLPVGIFQDENERVHVNFGKPFTLNMPQHLSKEERDRQATHRAMVSIGRLLPERMQGVYRQDIQAELVSGIAQ